MMKSKNKIQIYKPFEIRKIIIKRTWIKSKGNTNWRAFLNSKMPSAKNEVEREKQILIGVKLEVIMPHVLLWNGGSTETN